MKPIWVIGASGHAKVVIDTTRATGRFEVLGVLDDREECWHQQVLDVPVLGAASREVVSRLGVEHAVIAIGSNLARAKVAQRLHGLLTWATVVHPTAYLASGVSPGEGTVIFAGAIVQVNSAIGRHVILNTSCSVDHDSFLEDFVHLAPGVRLAGHVRVARGAFLGIGSCALPKCEIGSWATVGAGGVVVCNIPPGAIAMGVPARLRHPTTNEQLPPG